jgi:hypothetical protein
MAQKKRLPASAIERECLNELLKRPFFKDVTGVRMQPYAGEKGWTWTLLHIEPEVGERLFELAKGAIARLQDEID